MDFLALHEPSLNSPGESVPFPDMHGKVVIMTALPSDLKLLGKVFGFDLEAKKQLFCARVLTAAPQFPNLVVCGGFMGAPLAAMLLEVLAAKGARDFLFCGPCGSLDPVTDIGAIFLAEAAFANDGTVKHYAAAPCSAPHPEYHRVMKAILNTRQQRFARGLIASTDGMFRETLSLVNYFKHNNCRAVDMETAALFAVAKYLNVKMCSINVISDVFCNETWLNGIGSGDFKRGRAEAIKIIKEMVVWMQKAILI